MSHEAKICYVNNWVDVAGSVVSRTDAGHLYVFYARACVGERQRLLIPHSFPSCLCLLLSRDLSLCLSGEGERIACFNDLTSHASGHLAFLAMCGKETSLF